MNSTPGTPQISPKSKHRKLPSVINSIKKKISPTKSHEEQDITLSFTKSKTTPNVSAYEYSPRRTRSATAISQSDPCNTAFCIPECTVKHKKDMIRCMHCNLWCHLQCVGEPLDYSGVWSCFECCKKPKQILTLMTDIGYALKQLRNLDTSVASIATDTSYLKELVESLSSELCALRISNSDLLRENKILKDELTSLQTVQATSRPESKPESVKHPVPTPDLLIGSSVIRNIHPVNSTELEVNCISGVKFEGVRDVLDKLSSKQKKYSTIHIVTGSTDCQQMDASTETIKESAKCAVDSALKISKKVVLSSVLPRTDNGSAQLKSENVNLSLKSLCDQHDTVSYCDNNGSFLLSDQSVNDALLLRDGLHLNFKGTQKLISNLRINATVQRFQKKFTNPWINENQQAQQSWNNRNYSNTQKQRFFSNPHRPPPLLPTPVSSFNGPSCENCRQIGHTSYQCPKTKNVICYKCRSVGHRQTFCHS